MTDEETLKKIKEAHDEALRRIDLAVADFKKEMAEVKGSIEADRIAQLKTKLTAEE